MACRRLAVLQGYYECKSPLSYRCFVALVPVRCCICRCSRWLSCTLWLCVYAGCLIPLLSVSLYRAPLSLCLYGCILSAALSCAIWTAAALAPPLSPCLQRTWLRLILPYKIRWYFVIFRPCGFKASKAV